MHKTIILQGISLDEFLVEVKRIVEETINEHKKGSIKKGTTEYKTRKEVAEILRISLPTLNEWTKMGFIRSYRVGRRILYKVDEIDHSLKERKHYRK